jgi:hypothetical protein
MSTNDSSDRRTLAAVGNTVDVARQLDAQPYDDGNARIVLSEAVAIAAGFDTRDANWREVVRPGDALLKVTSIDGATALFKAQAATVG